MSHKNKIERHIVVDILSSAFGGAAVTAVVQKSWLGGVLALLLALGLVLLERSNIEEEE